MYEINLFGIKIGVSFSFFAVVSVVLLWHGDVKQKVMTALLCCLLHEIGHIVAMLGCGVRLKNIIFYGGGILIGRDREKLSSEIADIVILLAGCVTNFALAAASYMLCGENYFFTVSLFCGFFNLLPLKYFDGGQVIDTLFHGGYVCDILRCVTILGFAGVCSAMAFDGMINVSLVVTFGYIALSELFL